MEEAMVSAGFVLGVIALLATPGPTNTLLFVGAATAGVSRSLWLLVGEVSAYLASVVALGFIIGPAIAASPFTASAIRMGAAAYLLHAAFRLWRRGVAQDARVAVTPGTVAVTTFLNPKGLVIAFTLMPAGWDANLGSASAHLGVLAILIPLVGFGWLYAGACIGPFARPRFGKLVPRAAAIFLTFFSLALVRAAMAT